MTGLPERVVTPAEERLRKAVEWLGVTIDRHTDECPSLRRASEGGAETDLDSAFGDVQEAVPHSDLVGRLAGALASFAYVTFGPGRGFDQPEGSRTSDGITWMRPSVIRALLDEYAATSGPAELASRRSRDYGGRLAEDWRCVDCGTPLEPGTPQICEECVEA